MLTEDDKAKHEAARRWIAAVNNWGKLGYWAFHVCRDPQLIERELLLIFKQNQKAA
jgi:type III restriction enzyme